MRVCFCFVFLSNTTLKEGKKFNYLMLKLCCKYNSVTMVVE